MLTGTTKHQTDKYSLSSFDKQQKQQISADETK